MGKDEPVISFKNYSFQYFAQAEPTLNDICLDIYPGEKILIVGPSGSGKSTLGHCLNGLNPFAFAGKSTGSLKIAGMETSEQSIFNLSKYVGTVLQDSDNQFVGLTVGEDIAFSLENDCVPQGEMRERVKKVAQMVDIDSMLGSSPFELSGGQKQRTSLAGVMVDDVDILLFDEPLANLDPATGKAAIEIIDNIHKNSGKTVVIIEHRLEDVLYKPIDRIIVVNDGKIIADMNVHDLVCSDVLVKNGIREPLYVTALKYAGVTLNPEMMPGYIDTLKLSNSDKAMVSDWFNKSDVKELIAADETILKFDNINFAYNSSKHILKNINFGISKGEMVSIVGRNGAGKTTITKLVCGFVNPISGSIKFGEKDLKNLTIKERSAHIGLVMQNPNQMISEALITNEVALGLKIRGVSKEEQEERVKRALKICGLSPFEKWPISALSYGQKKRVTIASMLVLDPQVLILDEPTAGQDFRHYTEIMKFLEELNKQGITIILITHDMHLMLEYTPRAIVLSEGQIVADAPASHVLTNNEVIDRANLKETSLYTLSKECEISDGTAFVQSFIDYERQAR